MGNVHAIGMSYSSLVSLSQQVVERRVCASEVGPRVAVSRHFLVACWLTSSPEMRDRGKGNFAWWAALPVFPPCSGAHRLLPGFYGFSWLQLFHSSRPTVCAAALSSAPISACPWCFTPACNALRVIVSVRESQPWRKISHSVAGLSQ